MKKVLMLGRELTGKTSFLQYLAEKYSLNVEVENSLGFNIRRLGIDDKIIPSEVVLFETNQGALWDREKTVSEMLLDTDLVVIFFDTSDWCEEYHVTKDTLINHFDALDKHFVLAKKLNKSFKEIPWIFVLNKIDLDLREPFSKYLKEYGDFKVHQISVLKDIGITSLIDEIVKKLKNY